MSNKVKSITAFRALLLGFIMAGGTSLHGQLQTNAPPYYPTGQPYAKVLSGTANPYNYDFTSDWAEWKSYYVTPNGAGGYLRVQRDKASNWDTVSEGIGYGMLLSVYLNDQPTFDQLFLYCKAHFVSSAIPLMHWKVDSAGNNVSEYADYQTDDQAIEWTTGRMLGSNSAKVPHDLVYGNLTNGKIFIVPPGDSPEHISNNTYINQFLKNNPNYYPMDIYDRKPGSATDADADIAAALCFAYKKWSGGSPNGIDYSAEAKSMITAMDQNDFGTGYQPQLLVLDGSAGAFRYFIKNGSLWGDHTGWNPSYFTPAYYKNVFAKQCPEQAAFWNKVYDTMCIEMGKIRNYEYSANSGMYKFYPDWCNTSGAGATGTSVTQGITSDRFYYNNAAKGTGPTMTYPQSAMWATGTVKADYNKQCMSINMYYDAIRVPWRAAVDFSWTPVSGNWGGGYNTLYGCYYAFQGGWRPLGMRGSIVDGYTIMGTAWDWNNRDGFNNSVGGQFHSSTFIAMGATTALIFPVGATGWWETVRDTKEPYAYDNNYYGNTLRLLSMVYLSGRFTNLYQ